MMSWYGHHVGGWGLVAMSISMILFWAVVIAALVLLFRAFGRPREHTRPASSTAPTPTPTPEQILAERFARGEIDDEEYRRRLSVLKSPGGPAPPP